MGSGQWLVASGQWSVVRVKFGVWRVELSHRGDWVRIAVRSAASAPSEGFGFRAPPVADTARKASRCRPQVRERIAEARAANGEGAKLSSLTG